MSTVLQTFTQLHYDSQVSHYRHRAETSESENIELRKQIMDLTVTDGLQPKEQTKIIQELRKEVRDFAAYISCIQQHGHVRHESSMACNLTISAWRAS